MDVPGTWYLVPGHRYTTTNGALYREPGNRYQVPGVPYLFETQACVLLCTVHYIHAAVPVHVHVFAILIRSIRNTGMLDLSDKYTYKT